MFVVGYGVPWQEACALRPAWKTCAPCIKLGFMHLPWMVPSISHYPFLQSIYLSSLFLSCPSFSLSFIQVDKLDASESLRKEEEQLTEAQPIVYGRTLALPLHLKQGCQTQFLEGRNPAKFCSNPAPKPSNKPGTKITWRTWLVESGVFS